ncbi:DUF302 domain-containing protein [Hydrogenimonas cancrithermarum]|uniref:DUF302 domain-containing protein n=1 Tax=Hydrogenimonas cancrithermarum TaxID=2993563 RepID=A0ABM8FMZ2_9BACT|nr:DUF302 domain-containing protein [Hydrogenimonas cancrithermarum]BDY13752.1 hypothetical protein HCR_20640 [Hydrogenimonas cancrithermarum]
MIRVWLAMILAVSFVCAENGMIRYKSRYTVDETTKRLVEILREKGVTLFKVIDHAEGAKRIGSQLPPSRLVIFGNPKMGTPLMRCSPSIGLDLPQKMLVYENDSSEVMVTYNAPAYLFWRHNVPADCAPELQKKMSLVLEKFAKYAAGIE